MSIRVIDSEPVMLYKVNDRKAGVSSNKKPMVSLVLVFIIRRVRIWRIP